MNSGSADPSILKSSQAETSSWAARMQASLDKKLKKFSNPSLSPDGIPRVKILVSVFQRGADLHQDFILGIFMGKTPSFGHIQSVLTHIWGKGMKLEIPLRPESRSILVCILNASFEQKSWNKRFGTLETLCSKLHSGLGRVADALGLLVECDEFTRRMVNINVAHLKIKADCTKTLPTYADTERDNGDIVPLYVDYPWKPPTCPCCKEMGHLESICPTGSWKAKDHVVASPSSSPATVAANTRAVPSLANLSIQAPRAPALASPTVAASASVSHTFFTKASMASECLAPSVITNFVDVSESPSATSTVSETISALGDPLTAPSSECLSEYEQPPPTDKLGVVVFGKHSKDTDFSPQDGITHLLALPAHAKFRPAIQKSFRKNYRPVNQRLFEKSIFASPKKIELTSPGFIEQPEFSISNAFFPLEVDPGAELDESSHASSQVIFFKTSFRASYSHPRRWLVYNRISFGAILETHIKESSLNQVMNEVCPHWSFASNHADDVDGRIILIWKAPSTAIIIHSSRQSMTSKVVTPGSDSFYFTAIYAANTSEKRNDLWIELLYIQSSLIMDGLSWMFGGDFNKTFHPISSYCISNLMLKHKELRRALKTLYADNFSQIQKRLVKATYFFENAQLLSLQQPSPANFLSERQA
ncbi:unnamed protein product [Thlaspi arvense]|uniref:Uncharacterized protein n=1 Tax=Thlaspi arvense TaxID=13288 RepID=A0AAU9T5U3_THLAR|nr:unnamed protein product [Thlaspi arvense]